MSYAVFPWTLPYLMSCISILSILVYIHVLFLYALSLSTLIFCYHSTVEEIAYISFFQVQLFFWILLLPVSLHLTAFFPLLLFSHYVMLFFSILSSGPLQQWLFSGFPLHLCNLSSLFPPFLFLLSSFSSHNLLDLFLSLHTSYVPVLTGTLEGQFLNECECHMNISCALFLFT